MTIDRQKVMLYSVTLAPLLLALLWNNQNEGSELSEDMIYIGGASIGCVLRVAAYTCTKPDQPPQKLLLPWVLARRLLYEYYLVLHGCE